MMNLQLIEQDRCTVTPLASLDCNVATGEETPTLKISPCGTNWPLWKESTEKEAQRKGVWQYCDPDISEEFCPQSEQPNSPQNFSMVLEHKTSMIWEKSTSPKYRCVETDFRSIAPGRQLNVVLGGFQTSSDLA
jgi:hypothetical protein